MTNYDNYYKEKIVEYLVQASRVELLGYYLDKGVMTYLSGDDIKRYIEYFEAQARYEAMCFVKSKTVDIDYSVDE